MASTRSLRLLVGFLFTFSSLCKLILPPSPYMVDFYTNWANVSPLAAMGFTVQPLPFMKAISLLEFGFAVLLLMGSLLMKRVSCVVLSFLVLGALHTLVVRGQFLTAVIPMVMILCIVFVLLTADEEIKPKYD